MAVWSLIKKSELEGSNRLDPECYQPIFIETYQMIDRISENCFLGEIMYSFGSGRNLEQEELAADNIPFIRTQNVRPILISDSGMSAISKHNKNAILLNTGDILSVRVGEGVGNCSVVTPNYNNSAFSDNVIRFKVKKINPFYLITYLNSKYGELVWKKVSKGTARSLVSKENYQLIKLPVLSDKVQNLCNKLIIEATFALQESRSLYSQAEQILLEELRLKDLDLKDDLFCTMTLKEVKDNNRMDTEYYMPKYEKLMEH
ncbi:unnamed protein product, partial [marine sediment metagenome]